MRSAGTCRGSGFEWVFKAPEANLFDAKGLQVGTHFAGPSWKAGDGSVVVGEVASRADAPDTGAIPWLLLRAKSKEGTGVLSTVASFVAPIPRAAQLRPRAAMRPIKAIDLGEGLQERDLRCGERAYADACSTRKKAQVFAFDPDPVPYQRVFAEMPGKRGGGRAIPAVDRSYPSFHACLSFPASSSAAS